MSLKIIDKKYCCVCSKQIINGKGKSNNIITYGPVTLMGFGEYCCYECSQDLDENGLFPEERSALNRY